MASTAVHVGSLFDKTQPCQVESACLDFTKNQLMWKKLYWNLWKQEVIANYLP